MDEVTSHLRRGAPPPTQDHAVMVPPTCSPLPHLLHPEIHSVFGLQPLRPTKEEGRERRVQGAGEEGREKGGKGPHSCLWGVLAVTHRGAPEANSTW